jgi:aldehyde:ferredoxin oxidoreductase
LLLSPTNKGRSLGRGGGGAVFGAKNLYAIAVVPDRSGVIEVADEESLDFKNESGAAFKAKIKLEVGKFSRKEEHYGSLSSMGSLCLCGMVNNYGQLVHKNMQDTSHKPEDIQHITGEPCVAMRSTPNLEKRKSRSKKARVTVVRFCANVKLSCLTAKTI